MEIKEFLTIFDIELPEGTEPTVEEITKQKDAKWVGRAVVESDEEIVKKITGKRLGSLETEIKRTYKELGVEFAPEDTKDKKLEDIIKIGATKVNDQIAALKAKGNEGADKKLQDAQKEIENWQKKQKETEELLANTKTLYDTTVAEHGTVLKNFKLNHILGETKSKMPFAETANEFSRKGFDAIFSEKYKVDIDDKDNVLIMDKDGNKIKNSAGTDFKTYADVYKEELEKAGLAKVNNGGGAGSGQKFQQHQNNGGNAGSNNGGGPAFAPHPNANVNASEYVQL